MLMMSQQQQLPSWSLSSPGSAAEAPEPPVLGPVLGPDPSPVPVPVPGPDGDLGPAPVPVRSMYLELSVHLRTLQLVLMSFCQNSFVGSGSSVGFFRNLEVL